MKKSHSFFSGIIFGLVISLALFFYTHAGFRFLAFVESLSPSQPLLVHCAAQVNTNTWKVFHSAPLGFEFHYPSTYVVQEETGSTVVKITDQKSINQITLEKIRGSLQSELLPDMRQAAWKIADRQLYALATPNFTNDDGSLSSTYLFVRDFPLNENSGNYVMIRATIRTSAKEFDAAKKEQLVDLESVLTGPEQILSTFRFLQFDELPGADRDSAL